MKKSAFTLVEILIVVIILGILAAIVIPQFTQASNDARNNSLLSDLQTVRSQIQLYKVQHLDNFPTANISTELTLRSNQAGTTAALTADPNTYPLGPYLQKFPTNGYTNSNAVNTTGTPSNTVGWCYSPATGVFQADDTVHAGF